MIDGSEWKPIMLVLHDSKCDADIHCRELRREFVENKGYFENSNIRLIV